MEKDELGFFDDLLYRFLDSHESVMPKRLGKMIALYYADARIRKKYGRFIGVEMGEGTYANLGMQVVPNDNEICVHIGNHVSIAPNVTFLGGTEPNNAIELKELNYIKNRVTYYKDIYVDDEVWLGAGVIVFPGVHIGKGAIIGAGSVVMKDVEPYSVYVGTPAKKIREDIREN